MFRYGVVAVLGGLLALAAPSTRINPLSVEEPANLAIARNGSAEVIIKVKLLPGWFVYSNAPKEYEIPTMLRWEGPLQVGSVTYPKPQILSKERALAGGSPAFSGEFEIKTTLGVPSGMPPGPGVMTARLRYAAFEDQVCLPPKSVEITLHYTVQ